jgi:hypothetical protein
MIRAFGCIEGFRVAAVALGGKPKAIELPNRPHLVARIAVHHRVRANQRKTILVLVDVMNRHLPSIGVVAQFAFGAVLATMQIGMTVLAFVGSIGELQIRVAVPACHSHMASLQSETGLRMIELDAVLDHLPIRGCVAVDAGYVELAVRALRGSAGQR